MSEGSPRYGAGVAASLIAEAVFIGMVAMVSAIRGTDPWRVIRMPAAFLVGPAAVEPPGFVATDIAVGLLAHVSLGVLVGLIYARLLPFFSISPITGGLIGGALLYGLGFWALPLLFAEWLAPFWLPVTGKILEAVAHAVYGVVFGAAYRRLT